MALSITHQFVSGVADGADTSVVRPSNWNATHTVSGTLDLTSQVTGTLPIANGGTNATSLSSNAVDYFDGTSIASMGGTSWDNTNRSLTITGATVTASKPIFDLSQTWNNAGVTFTGLKLNITSTAAAGDSKLLDLQVGGSTVSKIDGNGTLLANVRGTDFGFFDTAAHAANFSSTTGRYGYISTFGGQLVMAFTQQGAGITFASGSTLSDDGSGTAGILELQRGLNPNTLRVYNTRTDTSNYERGVFDWTTTSNRLTIGAQAAGTGTLRVVDVKSAGIQFNSGHSGRWMALGGVSGTSFPGLFFGTSDGAALGSGAPGYAYDVDASKFYIGTGVGSYNGTLYLSGVVATANILASNLDDRNKFYPANNEPPSSNFATLDTRNGHPVLDFDDTTAEGAVFTGVLMRSYGGTGITVEVAWSATSATTGTIGWTIEIERVGATQDTDSDSFASAQTITAATVSGTSGVCIVTNVAITDGANMDSTAAGEQYRIRIKRDVANDTATGDAELHWVSVRAT